MALRLARPEDLPRLLEIYGPYVEHTTVTFEYTAPTPEEFARRFSSVTARFPWLVWEEEGLVLGYAYACAPFERPAYGWIAEPSVYLDPQARGRGIGRALYRALEALLQALGYRLSYAIITSENQASLAFHRRMGYRQLAVFPQCAYKQGRCLGITWMEKRLGPADLPSKAPESFSAFVQNTENQEKILDILSLS